MAPSWWELRTDALSNQRGREQKGLDLYGYYLTVKSGLEYKVKRTFNWETLNRFQHIIARNQWKQLQIIPHMKDKDEQINYLQEVIMTLKFHQETKQAMKSQQPTDHQQADSTAQHSTEQAVTPWNYSAKKKSTSSSKKREGTGKGMRRQRGGKGKGQDDKGVKRQTRVISSSNVYWICSVTGTHFIGSDYLQHLSGEGNSTESWKEIKQSN